MRKKRFSFPWSRYISGFLVFLLLFSQTIRVDFFDVAEASPENYRDIVSIFVDTDTYGANRSEIMRYAHDIEGYLGGTRVSLFVVDTDTPPAIIAAKNERLYYEGDGGGGVSHLVGTVLIGNVAIPMVGQDGSYFPSLYPYVDFVDKQFVYNTKTSRYEVASNATRESVEPEIWHGVINPAVGRSWEGSSDVEKIRAFLNKTHDFYTKSGKFAPSNIPPRVFYYDGFYESQSVNIKSLFQYGLSMQNAENVAYKRFTKYLLKDINSAILQFDKSNNQEYNDTLSSLGVTPGSDGFDDATIDIMPDIQTEAPIMSFLKDFKSIINEKTLGDAMLYVHNAGRYNSGSTVRVDLAPVTMTLMDTVARSTLKEANTAMEGIIDGVLTGGGIAKRIPIFDHIETSVGAPLASATGSYQTYDNYFFGARSNTITSPEQCSIARGSDATVSQFGRDVLVEANTAYDIMSVSGQVDMMKNDTEELVNIYRNSNYSCFTPSGTAKLASYWGGNSILRVAGSPNAANVLQEPPGATSLVGFSQPIFSLGGMKETTRMDPASVADCMSSKYQYAMTSPYERTYTVLEEIGDGGSSIARSCLDIFPTEWSTLSRFGGNLPGACGARITSHAPRFTCITEHRRMASIPTLAQSLQDYASRTCYAGTLTLNGQAIRTANRTCITDSAIGDTTPVIVDTTTYENQVFHTIPSLLRHISPTDEEISAAKGNGVTPSLPVDTVRYVEFLTPKGNIARLTYPNFFDTPGTDVASVRAWLRDLATNEWQSIIAQENGTNLSAAESSVNSLLGVGAFPAAPIDWNNYISDAFIEKVLQSKNWLNPDATVKYKQSIETALSYSHRYPGSQLYDNPPNLPTLSDSYEIAYLGLTSFLPSAGADEEYSTTVGNYNAQIAEIQGLNVSEPYDSSDNNPSKDSDKCGPPEGVDLFKWPQAIMCWIQSLMPPRIMAGSCGADTIGTNNSSGGGIVSPTAAMSASGALMRSFYEGGRVRYQLSRVNMGLGDTIEATVYYEKNGNILALPPGSKATITPTRTLGSEYFSVSPGVSEVSGTGAQFILSSGQKPTDVTIQATLGIRLPGDEVYTVTGDQQTIHISDEYLDILPTSGTTQQEVTSPSPITFDYATRNGSGDTLTTHFPLSLDVYDEVNNTRIGTGITVSSSAFTLPDKYAKTVGVYRLVFTDPDHRTGEVTLAIRSGPLTSVTLTPISSMIVKGADTLAMIELKDALGNLISPELHSVDITIDGGYLVDSTGQRRTTMHIDAMEPQIPVLVTADNAGRLTLRASIDTGLNVTTTIQAIESARVELIRPTVPRVGGTDMNMSVQVVDEQGALLTGFNSAVTLTLPGDAGYFTPTAAPVRDGVASVVYTPGTYAGSHALEADIPGIGKISDIAFSLLPGAPMYINHKEEGGNIIFTIRDRYGNPVTESLEGTIKRNNDTPITAIFSSGTYTLPARSGYYTVQVPDIENSAISYTDSAGIHAVNGIPYYATYITGTREQFDFLPDYNARYTVLTGGDFLREGEDILFNTTAGSGQSLAVSTLLDTPYTVNTLFSIIPGGGYTLSATTEQALDAQVTVEQGFPVLAITDTVSHTRIARAVYHMYNANLDTCTYSGSEVDSLSSCLSHVPNNQIRIALDGESGFQAGVFGGNLLLQSDGESIVTLYRDGRMSLVPGLSLVPDTTSSQDALVMDVQIDGETIAKIIYATDKGSRVEKSSNPFTTTTYSTPLIEASSSVSSSEFSPTSLASGVTGYRFTQVSNSPEIDAVKNGPNTIDALAITPDVPGVGWQGNNRMLLSYAAGDTVGESTKWFHTYTFVNLGDPVAHVDEGAPGTLMDGLDRSIGTQITSGASPIASFAHRDMDADGYEDVIALRNDGYLDLVLNQRGKFRYRERIAYTPDLVTRGITLGDFTHDNYADIIGINNSGSFIYIDNTIRKLARMEMQISGASGGVPTGVTQFKVYDMDTDGRDDIVYLTEGGELGVLYGTATAGSFEKKVLDANLGVSLSGQSSSVGGALKMDGIPQFPNGTLGVSPTTSTGVDASQLETEVYYQYPRPSTVVQDTTPLDLSNTANLYAVQGTLSTSLADAEASTSGTPVDTYVKSQYAPAFGIEVERTFDNVSNPTLHAGDQIEVTISLHNSGSTTARNITYLDTVPTIFSADKTLTYQVIQGGQTITRDFQYMESGDYDAYFVGRDIPPGQTLTIKYQLTALPASYGEMLVGDYEQGETGVDVYGDVGFKTSTTCGADMLLWRSGPASRDYTKGSRSFSEAEIPASIASQIADANGNGIPDSMEMVDTNGDGVADSAALSLSDRQAMLNKLQNKNSGSSSRPLMNATMDTESNKLTLGFDSSAVDEIATMGDNLMSGLQCGFGGGGCMSFPLNWAPLAPGGDPTVLGTPVGDGLKIDEGLPLLSALTRLDIGITPWCITIPMIWPISPMSLDASATCSSTNVAQAWGEAIGAIASQDSSVGTIIGAGGVLGTDSASNFLRIFVTPTLTMGMGAAICFGGPASSVGKAPGLGLSPLIQGGNCIVITDKMNVCKGDGSSADGDVRGISGLGSIVDTWNAKSCTLQANTSEAEDSLLTGDIISYLKSPNTTRLNNIYSRLQNRSGTRNLGGPMFRMGAGTSGTAIGVEVDSSKSFNLGNIVKVKNKRISGFPDFVMDWVGRQGDEIVKALFTVPHITLYAPTTLGQHAQFDGSFGTFLSKFSGASMKQGSENLATQMGNASSSTNAAGKLSNKVGNTNSSAGKSVANWQQQAVGSNASTINSAAGGLSAMRAAYKFIGKLPFVTISSKTVPINVPWILPSELDRYERALSGYNKEVNQAANNLCANKTATECANAKASLSSGGFTSSINQNLKRIQEYKDFPVKLQKYVTWKQRYMSQILCNINTISQLTGGWLKDNGLRFRKWAELYVLIKAIAESWQPVLDIFTDTSKQCGVCRNQRYDLTYWKFKMISAVIPSIPVIKFPRWPNIVLDLSDVQLGINIAVPDFQFNLTPIKLPNLPSLALPNFGVGVGLPSLDLLPALPNLPDLPNLPSLPKLALPNLPSPPKLPKIFGAVSSVLKIFKLISKMYCWYNSTYLISEDQVGSVIADRTERQGTMSFDFLDVQFPNASIQSLKEIRVSSHVNFNIRSDFITEFARAAVKPINSFTTDLSRGAPKKVGEDVNIQGQKVNVKLQTKSEETPSPLIALQTLISEFETENSGSLEVGDFAPFLESEFDAAGLPPSLKTNLKKGLAEARQDQEKLTQELVDYNAARFDALRKYIQAKYDETAEMQEIIDTLTREQPAGLVYNEANILERKKMVAENQYSKSEALKQAYEEEFVYGEIGYDDAESIRADSAFAREATLLETKIRRVAADIGGGSTTSSAPTAAGYAPSFDGIYVLTASGTQTKLFDYTDPLTGDERVETTDIDKDGDKDYLFLLDGTLFVKYTHTTSPTKIQDDSVNIQSIGANDELPVAPNFFHESLNTPESLSVTFTPSRDTERAWRMEFFDHYLEWDAVDIGTHAESATPKRVVDIFTSTGNVSSLGTESIQATPVSRSLERVYDASTFMMEGPRMTIMTGSTHFTVSPGKIIYTGDSRANILYHTGANTDAYITLEPHQGYRFNESIEATLQSGKLYVITSSISTEPYIYTDDMIGMPVLEGMRLTSSAGGFVVRDFTQNTSLNIAPGSDYMMVNVGYPDETYNFNIDYPNGYYSARLGSLGDTNTRAGIVLIAPQASSDRSAPVVEIPESIRIPVYTTESFQLRDYVTERSTYTAVIDPDITTDSNGNGIVDDDFSLGGSGVTLSSGVFTVGTFDVIGKRTAQMKVTDEFNNVTDKVITIEAYAPIPQITQIVPDGWVSGKLNEVIAAEPVHLFRVRPGTAVTRLNDTPISTITSGTFSSGTFFGPADIQLSLSGTTMHLSENGVFSAIPTGVTTTITPASKTSPMYITLRDSNSVVYRQFLSIPPGTPIVDGAQGSVSGTGKLIVTPSSPYQVAGAGTSDPSIPGGAYLVDASHVAVAALDNGGNIYALASGVTLHYGQKDGYLIVTVKNSGATVAEVWYKLDLFYTVK